MLTLFEIVSGLVIGAAGFARLADDPLQGCWALLLAGFLLMTGVEKTIFKERRKPEA